MYINNINNIDRQQQFRSPTSRAARGMKEIGLDSLDFLSPSGRTIISYLATGSNDFFCPIGLGDVTNHGRAFYTF